MLDQLIKRAVRSGGLSRAPRLKERCRPPWRPFAIFISVYLLFLFANPWWRLHPRPRLAVPAKFEEIIELPRPTSLMRANGPMEFMNAALIPCDGYIGAFARLNDQVNHMSWPLWMPLDSETFKPILDEWQVINITDWVPVDGRGFRSSGYEDLRVVRHKGQIWTSGTASFRVEGRAYGAYRPMLVAWNDPKGLTAPTPTDRRYVLTEEHAKNWGPFVEDEQLYLFQHAQPLRICVFNLDHCDTIAEIPHTLRPFSPSLIQAPSLRAARLIGRIPANVTRDQWEYLCVAHYRVDRWRSRPWYFFVYFTVNLHGVIRIKRFSNVVSFEELGPSHFWYLHTSSLRPRPAATLERMKLTELCKFRPLNHHCYEVVSTISPSDYGAYITIQSLATVLELFPS